MGQLRLFEDSVHLDQCPDDPPINAFEHIYYTPWRLLYPEAPAQLAEVLELNANVVELFNKAAA